MTHTKTAPPTGTDLVTLHNTRPEEITQLAAAVRAGVYTLDELSVPVTVKRSAAWRKGYYSR